MRRPEPLRQPAPGIVLMLVVAVLLCFALPMIGGSADAIMDLAMIVCCFALAIALSAFMLRRPARAVVPVFRRIDVGVRLARGDPVRRGPDPITLGVLLI